MLPGGTVTPADDGALQVRFDVADRIAGLGKRLRAAPQPEAAAEPEAPAHVEPQERQDSRPEPSPAPLPDAEPTAEEPRRGFLQRLLGL